MSDHKTNSSRIFPNESADGIITLNDNKITYNSVIASPAEVNLDRLQYAYVVVIENKQAFLFLFDDHPHYLPANYAGFKNMYDTLSERFGFEDAVFFEHINASETHQQQIWRRTYEPSYEVLQTNHSDYAKGFEIQSPDKLFVSWDATFEEFLKNPYISFQESPYIQKVGKFAYPVRIGNILLKNFHLYYDFVRQYASVLQFYSPCFDARGTDKSFTDLKAILLKDLGIDRNRLNYDRADQKNLTYNFASMSLSICYTYDSDRQFNAGYTSLSVENKCDYLSLLIDQAYEDRMLISDYIVLQEDIRISDDYKRNSRIKRRPQQITDQFENKTVIWMDERNDKIGFSSTLLSQVFHQDEIKSFRIQNILPARGTGSSYLELVLENQTEQYIVLKGRCNAFDVYAEQLKILTHKEVVFEIDDHDC